MKLNDYDTWNELSSYDTSVIAQLRQSHRLYTLKNRNLKLSVAPSLGGRLLALQASGFTGNLFRGFDCNLKGGYEEYAGGPQDNSIKAVYTVEKVDADSITLNAELGNGLEVTRRIWLDREKPLFSISSVYRNTGRQPVKIKLHSHPEFSYDTFKDFSVYVETQSGWRVQDIGRDVQKTSLDRWFLPATFFQSGRNSSRWLLGNQKRNIALIHTFNPKEIQQFYYYRSQSLGCVNMELFAIERTLRPQETATLNQSYEICLDLAKWLAPTNPLPAK